ncbi:MAG TPA: hypothetical protein P5308_04180 [Syntrophales bacterium]|nr:hypothetical protein [Syntrophobacterales bacterium]HRT70539.1 hypothetical protein [Syntrophales bacterium]
MKSISVNRSPNVAGLIFFLVVSNLPFFISGCASGGDVITTTRKVDITSQKIAVVPFQLVTPEDPTSHTVRRPLVGTLSRSCPSTAEAAEAVEELFLEKLNNYKNITVIPVDKVEGIYERIAAESFKTKPLDVLIKVGKELEADIVAVGYVYCYRERKGYAYGADVTASVTFDISLVRTSDGTVIWSSYFDKTQAPLSDNLLEIGNFARGGWKWLTARELSAEGIEKMMSTFPVSR